jgi:hypothetical protein
MKQSRFPLSVEKPNKLSLRLSISKNTKYFQMQTLFLHFLKIMYFELNHFLSMRYVMAFVQITLFLEINLQKGTSTLYPQTKH